MTATDSYDSPQVKKIISIFSCQFLFENKILKFLQILHHIICKDLLHLKDKKIN